MHLYNYVSYAKQIKPVLLHNCILLFSSDIRNIEVGASEASIMIAKPIEFYIHAYSHNVHLGIEKHLEQFYRQVLNSEIQIGHITLFFF